MRMKWKSGIALVLSVCMIPMPVSAQTIFPAVQDKKVQKVTKQTNKPYAEGEAIILYKDSSANIKTFQSGKRLSNDIEIVETYDFETTSSKVAAKSTGTAQQGVSVSLVKSDKYSTKELIDILKKRSDVKYAEPNYRIKALDVDDPYQQYQWEMENIGQNGGTKGLDMKPDTPAINKDLDDKEKVIALIDTGIDYTHEELQDVVWNNPVESKKLKGAHGYDFINLDDDPLDDNGHGSHCSGIMAATAGNGVGIRGTATSSNVKIMGLKILDEEGYGYGMEAVGAYNYVYKAQKLGVNVVAVNNSWGMGADEDDIEEGSELAIMKEIINLVGEAGALSVCAAGNEGENNDEVFTAPANLDSPYIISVAASNENDELAAFSNYGKKRVDIAAPGTDILSSVCYDTFNPILYDNKDEFCQVYTDFESGTPVRIGFAAEDEETEGAAIETSEVSDAENDVSETSEVTDTENDVSETSEGSDTENDVTENTAVENAETAKTETVAVEEATAEDKIAYQLYSDGDGDSTVSIADGIYFGLDKDGTKSLKWEIKNAEAGDYYNLMFPYDAETSSTPLYGSAFVRAYGPKGGNEEEDDFGWLFGPAYSTVYVGEGLYAEAERFDEDNINWFGGAYIEDNNYWSFISDKSEDKIKKSQKSRMMVFQVEAEGDGDYTIYIDNMGISKANVTSDTFGKYDFYNGTSMATPHVTAAVAAVANAFEDKTPLERKARILGSVRKSDNLKDVVKTGGILDFSNVINPKMSLENASLNDKKQIEINGYYMDGAQINVNGEIVAPLSADASQIVIDGSNYLNKTIHIEVVKGDEIVTEKLFFADGKSFNKDDGLDGTLNNGTVVSDGDGIYHVDTEGNVSYISDTYGQMEWENIYEPYTATIFGEEYKTVVDYNMARVTDVVCMSNKLYTELYLDQGYSEDNVIACFSKHGGWSKYAEVPDAFLELEGVTLAAYQGSLYLMGGYDASTGKASDLVMRYDETEQKWSKEASLPEARCFAKALQVGTQLVVTLGSDGKSGSVKNLIFDGNKWTVAKAALGELVEEDKYTYADAEEPFNITTAEIGLVKDGIVYTDLQVEDLGDTFIYNVKEDKYTSAGYCLNSKSLKGDEVHATTAKNKLYVLYGYGYEEDDWDIDYWSTHIQTKIDAEAMDYDGDDFNFAYDVSTLSMPIENGFVYIKDESDKESAYVDGAGYALPGDTVTLTAKANEGAYISAFTVDGKSVKADSKGNYTYALKTDGTKTQFTAKAEAGVYIADLFIYDDDLALGQGTKNYQLYVDIYPDNATSKKLKWQSSNTKVVTVDQNGRVTVASGAKVGQSAVITATATDRGTISAKCRITVTSATVKKNSKVTVGKFTYQVTSVGTKNTVRCIALNNKKAKSAKLPATVKINGQKFKVTAIGKKAFKNCKKLKKLTIKSTTITKFGKGTFQGCNKKLVVKVPKKSKKTYQKKLKKAGLKGKVK